MALPTTTTTLKDVADKEHATAAALAARAKGRLATADEELRAVQIVSRDAGALFTDLSAKDAELRRRLAEAADGMPADTAALSDELELNTVALREQGAKARAAQRAVATAKQAFLAAGEQARAAQAHLASATEVKAAAAARQKTLDDAEEALKQLPLTEVKDAATEASGDPLGAADARIEGDVPEELLVRAKARLALNAAELARAQAAAIEAAAAMAAAATTANGLPAVTREALAALQVAERDYLATLDGDRDLQRATAAIAAVTVAPPISDERVARMNSGPAHDAGNTADNLELEEKRDKARGDVLIKRALYEQAWVAALKKDAATDPDDDAGVLDAKEKLKEELQNLRDAEEALDTPGAAGEATPRDTYGRWEATVPVELWNAVIAVEAARATLDRLTTTDPGELASKLAAAEDAYALALEAQGEGTRKVEALAALAEERSAAADLALRTNSDLSAVRGDL